MEEQPYQPNPIETHPSDSNLKTELSQLKMKQAAYGFSTPPEVIMRIEDVTEELKYRSNPQLERPPQETDPLKVDLRQNKRRLRLLKLQAARFGIQTDPNVTIEISNLEKKIIQLNNQLSSR